MSYTALDTNPVLDLGGNNNNNNDKFSQNTTTSWEEVEFTPMGEGNSAPANDLPAKGLSNSRVFKVQPHADLLTSTDDTLEMTNL